MRLYDDKADAMIAWKSRLLLPIGIFVGLLGLKYVWDEWSNHYFRSNLVELAIIPSPDGKYQAIVVSNHNSGVKEGVLVYIVKRGEPLPEYSFHNLNADHVKDLDLGWKQSNLLEIRYKTARILHFDNLRTFITNSPFFDTIEISLLKDGEDITDLVH